MEYAREADRNLINIAQCHGILKKWRPPCAPAERVLRIVYEFGSEDIEWSWEDAKRRLEAKKQGICHREFTQFYLCRPDVRDQPAFKRETIPDLAVSVSVGCLGSLFCAMYNPAISRVFDFSGHLFPSRTEQVDESVQ